MNLPTLFLTEIVKRSNPYLVEMFIMFLDCGPSMTLVIKFILKNHIFTFYTSLKQPTGSDSYYARRLP